MRSPVTFSSEKQFEQCVASLRTHLVSLGGSIPEGEELRNAMARIAGYDTANEVILSLRASDHRQAAEKDQEDVDLDIFIYTLQGHQVMLQGRCDSTGLLWKNGAERFEQDLARWREDVLHRHLGLNNTSHPVDVRCVESDDAAYFVATLNLHSFAVEDMEVAYRMMDHFIVNQRTPWPGLKVAMRMVDELVLEAGMAEYPDSRGVLLTAHNALATTGNLSSLVGERETFLVDEFGEDMGPQNAKMIFGGNRLKRAMSGVQRETGSRFASDKAGLAKAASTRMMEATWRALVETLSMTLRSYEPDIRGKALSKAEFVHLVRKHDAHVRRLMTRAFFLGQVPLPMAPAWTEDGVATTKESSK